MADSDMEVELPTPRQVTLLSKQGIEVRVSAAACAVSDMLRPMLPEEDDEDQGNEPEQLPVPNVDTDVLQHICRFLEYNADTPMKELPLKALSTNKLSDLVQGWYADYVADMEQPFRERLVIAADYMGIQPLYLLCCAFMATIIRTSTPDMIRSYFSIVNDFTPEEEAEMRSLNKWVESV